MDQESKEQILAKNDWYEVSDEGEKMPGRFDALRAHGPLIIKIAMALIAAIVVIWGVVFLMGWFFQPDEQMQEQTRLYIQACQSENDVEKCIAGAGTQLAKETGSVEYCEELKDEEYDICIGFAASTAQDADICKKMKDSEREVNCNDAIVTNQLGSDYEYEDCEDLEDQERLESCQSRWVISAARVGNCEHEAVSDEVCAYGQLLQEAVDLQDPVGCELISDNGMQELCLEIVGPGDKDFDGLDSDEEEYRGTSDTDTDSDDDGLGDYEEIWEYETDPSNPDTDGDGYSDGDEVRAGYSPLR